MPSRNAAKYLQTYAEPEARQSDSLVGGPWEVAVAIPALAEKDSLPAGLEAVAVAASSAGARALAIIVVNAPPERPACDHEDNRRLLDLLHSRCGSGPEAGLSLGRWSDGLEILVVDRATPGRLLPPRSGVGHARKIAADIAVALWHRGLLVSPWLHMTDGDARVAPGYFDVSGATVVGGLGDGRPAALLHPYRHVQEAGWEEPMAIYDAFLAYYERGLRSAGSPYAFPTIGSTIVADLDAYATVRGFPRVQAGEDFYLLNKLAKVGPVATLRSEAGVTLRGRPSTRVPFGTGAGLLRIREARERDETVTWYDPATFGWLSSWLRHIDAWCLTPRAAWDDGVADPRLVGIARDLGAERAFDSALSTRKSAAARLRHLHEWFDAFRTLKFVHAVRDRYLPEVPHARALAAIEAGSVSPP